MRCLGLTYITFHRDYSSYFGGNYMTLVALSALVKVALSGMQVMTDRWCTESGGSHVASFLGCDISSIDWKLSCFACSVSRALCVELGSDLEQTSSLKITIRDGLYMCRSRT
jgi:hypothetical protein